MKYPKGYGMVFKKVLCDPSIRIEVKAIYALLASYTGADDMCWPSIATMAKALACSEQSVRNWAEELEIAGWLTIQRFNDGIHSNRYSLAIPEQVLNPGAVPSSTPVDPTMNSLTKNNDRHSLLPTSLPALRLPQADPKPMKIPRQTVKAIKKENTVRKITDYYQELFVEEYGAKPTWDGKIMKLVHADVARLGDALLGKLIQLFFEDPGSFVEKNGTGLGYNIFHSQIDRLLEKRSRMEKARVG